MSEFNQIQETRFDYSSPQAVEGQFYDEFNINATGKLSKNFGSSVKLKSRAQEIAEKVLRRTSAVAASVATVVVVANTVYGEPFFNMPDVISHTHYSEIWITEAEPTCTADGLRYMLCDKCGERFAEETVQAQGHVMSEWITDVEATCAVKGQSHRQCTVCGEILETAESQILEHSFGEWETVTAATCSKEGTQQRICPVCGASEEEIIDKLDHKFYFSGYLDDFDAVGRINLKCRTCRKSVEQLGFSWEIDETDTAYVFYIYDRSGKRVGKVSLKYEEEVAP